MVEHPIEGDFKQWVVNAFRQSPLFSALDAKGLEKVIKLSRLQEFESGETLTREGEESDRFWVVLMGEARALVTDEASGEPIELSRLRANDSVGEVGLLLERPRVATVTATKQTYALHFDRKGFDYLMERLPGFARRLSRLVADRLVQADGKTRFPLLRPDQIVPTMDLVKLIPADAIVKYRLIPVSRDGNTVVVAFVDPPTRDLAQRVRQSIGDLQLEVGMIRMSDFDRLVEQFNLKPKPAPTPVDAGATQALTAVPGAGATTALPSVGVPVAELMQAAQAAAAAQAQVAPQLPLRAPAKLQRYRGNSPSGKSIIAKLDDLDRIRPILEQMPQVNASDLHIGAGEKPRWRIDGDLYELSEFGAMDDEEVLDLFEPLMPDVAIEEFNHHHDCDFAFAVDGIARFRANIFRDDKGVGAALRQIPMHVMSMEKLGLPKAAREFCNLHQGLVLVCGPTGSGKSTTLAAMIDHINQTRRSHIVTLEDPIEYVHESKMSLVTQREVGKNTSGFTRGLRASLREDPDIVLVGELRDRETLELAMKTAQTGHLVLSTLHTSTAIGTIDRIIDMFPVDQHNQVRGVLADMLKGVINQHLCKRIGGGRVAAFECMVGGAAVGNCIRQGKVHQIETVMTTNRSEGHRYLNDDLWELVRSRAIEPLEALKHTENGKDLRARLGMAQA